MAAPIYCFCHCDKLTKIFYLNFPQRCPVCRQDTEHSVSMIPPCRVPSPLKKTSKCPCSIVIRPTIGHFIESYEVSSNLHIGITSSNGIVYDYDEHGVNVGLDSWEHTDCLSVELPHCSKYGQLSWDEHLVEYSNSPNWHKTRYHLDKHNCYDFIIGFVHHIGLASNDRRYADKIAFSENFVLPHTTKLAAYISLYRRIQQQGTVCQTSNST